MALRQIWSKVPASFRNQFKNGNIETVLGLSVLSFAGYVYLEELQRQRQMERLSIPTEESIALRKELRQKFLKSVEKQEEVRKEMLLKYKDSKSLFQCEVMVAFPLDGEKGLQGVEQGNILDIIEESVGPDGAYNVCRFTGDKIKGGLKAGQVGWYPSRCLKKVDVQPMSWIRWVSPAKDSEQK